MKKCPKCGLVSPDSTKFCPSCGEPLPENIIEPINPDYVGAPVNTPYPANGTIPPPRPIKAKNNTLLIIVCAAAAVIICGLLLYIFAGEKEKESAEEQNIENVEGAPEDIAENTAQDANNLDENQYDWLSDRLVTAADLQGKTAGDLRLMRNAIFARHGYKFKSDDLTEYFNNFSWYNPLYRDVNDRLSNIEKKNIDFISKYEGNGSSPSKSASVGESKNIGVVNDYSDIVCYQRLTPAELEGLSKSQLRIMRNTIYARHGRKFKSADLRNYFNNFSWYHGVYDEISPNSLSATEKHNIDLIQSYE